MMEREITAPEFKAKCLSLLDEVARTGESLVVTKRGKPVARVSKTTRKYPPLKGSMAGRGKEVGDIVYFDTTSNWECLK